MLDKAKALAKAGRFAEADQLFDKLVQQKPKNAVVLAEAVRFQNRYTRRFGKALLLSERLLTLKPKAAESFVLSAESSLNCQRLAQARDHAAAALHIAPDNPDALFIAAAVDMALNRHDEALEKIEQALRQQPDHLPSRIQLARALRASGDLGQAETLVRGLLTEHPNNASLLPLLFSVAKIERSDPELQRLTGTVLPALRKIGGQDFADALRLLAKAQVDFGEDEAAFLTTVEAKAAFPMKRDIDGYAAFVDALCSQTHKQSFDGGSGNPSERPLLIVGMPRSGSTLLEQMLTRHSKVESVGESPALHLISQSLRLRTHSGADMIKAIREMPATAANSLAQRYLGDTAPSRAETAVVIDKSLHNFELLGLFAKFLPRARVIHMLRDPLDTCVSCFIQQLSPWHSYTQDLHLLGRAYMQHRQVMDHWADVLPNPILTLRYEDLVSEPEATLGRALDFAGLEWETACLDFQSSANRSKTLSAHQVRQPLYASSIRRWERYDKFLDPLKAELRPLYPGGWTESYR